MAVWGTLYLELGQPENALKAFRAMHKLGLPCDTAIARGKVYATQAMNANQFGLAQSNDEPMCVRSFDLPCVLSSQ